MRRLRVIHLVDPTFGSVFSGHTHYLFSLLSGWKDDGISLNIYGTQIKPSNLNSGERVYRLPPGSLWSKNERQNRWGNIHWSFRFIWTLIVRQQDYDVIHFHNITWGSLLSPVIFHLLRKKVVFTMSLMGNDNPGHIIQQPRGRLQVALLRNFDGVICLSPALMENATQYGLRNVICLPNFLAIPQLEELVEDSKIQEFRHSSRAKLGIPAESQMLLFVGSIIQRKGVNVLIDAFVELSQKYPTLILVLVGPQSKKDTTSIVDGYIRLLKDKIQSAGLEQRVIWAGMVKEQACLVDYYRSADIFVFPTRNEGSPNVLAEAMSAGLPVIASLLPGITDALVSDGESGILVEVDRTDLFVHEIDRVLLDYPKRQAMGAAGRRIAHEKFGFGNYCRLLREFYIGIDQDNISLLYSHKGELV